MTVNSHPFRASLAKAKTILIVRPDNLGDLVLFSGALKQIRTKCPTARITICVKRFVAGYLELCPYIDDILIWEDVSSFLYLDYREKLRGLARRTLGRLLMVSGGMFFDLFMKSGLSFDVVLLPVRSPDWRQHLFVKTVAAPLKLGISGDFCNQTPDEDRAAANIYTARLNIPSEDRWGNELLSHASFLSFLGIATEPGDLWPRMRTDTSDRIWATREMARVTAGDSVRLAIVPGANAPQTKIYPAEKIAEAVSGIQDTTLSCVILGSAKDRIASDNVEQSLRKRGNVVSTLNLTGRTTIRQLIECLKLCDVALAIDSAPLHIATALRKPTVGIMGGGHFGRFYPWGDTEINRVAHKPMDCYFCNWRCANGNGSCVQDISPSVVARELRHLIDNINKGH